MPSPANRFVENHAPGDFCWVELATNDQAAAKAFYSKLFGWKAEDFPVGPGGNYTMFSLEGREAAAAFTLQPDMRALGIPPHWMPYVSVASADATAKTAAAAGGAVLAAPFHVMDIGRMAVIRDSTGAVLSLWQPAKRQGIAIAGANTFCWADLITPDAERASGFYTALFGWNFSLSPRDANGYLHIQNGKKWIGGIPPASAQPPNLPPHWMVWFEVPDCDRAMATASQQGAKPFCGPMTMERVGRIGILNDPQGAGFGLITPD